MIVTLPTSGASSACLACGKPIHKATPYVRVRRATETPPDCYHPTCAPADVRAELSVHQIRLLDRFYAEVCANLAEAFGTLSAVPALPAAPASKPVETAVPSKAKPVDGAHKQLAELLRVVRSFAHWRSIGGKGHANVYLVGPAGSGKTTLAEHLATALGVGFDLVALSGGTSESQVFGRSTRLPGEELPDSPFARVYRNGGVFLFDEIDGADPNVMLSVNAALANGHICVRGETIKRHADAIVLAAGNTYGDGADAVYVGRNPLDAATKDRFVGATIHVAYDRDLEGRIALVADSKVAIELLSWIWRIREAAQSNGLRRIVGTRMVAAGSRMIAAGYSLTDAKRALVEGWSAQDIAKAGASC
jgi:energy-coupling factor transporter ATP-binding protein EcfA2